MSLRAHLRELRKRLTIAATGLIVGMVVAFFITNPVIALLTEPIDAVARARGSSLAALNFNSISSGFDLRMRIAFAIGIIISAPVWLWQIWAFIMPGLTRKEKQYTVGFLASAIPLFFAGCFVGWLLLPRIVMLMSSLVPSEGAYLLQYDQYYDFVFKLLLVVGIAFILPVFLVALNLAGILSGKTILKGWRVAVIVVTLFSAMATPAADVSSMLLLGGILLLLYIAAATLSLIFDRRKARRARRLDSTQLPDFPDLPA